LQGRHPSANQLAHQSQAGKHRHIPQDPVCRGVHEIRPAIKDAAEGLGRLSPAIVTRVLAEFSRIEARAAATRDLFSDLTRREFDVLELLGKGYRNRAIADTLSLSEKTVKTHVGAILRKLHPLDRTQAALLAQERGLAPPRSEV
jgi:DNA-binding NarL/FixJ family response regulator